MTLQEILTVTDHPNDGWLVAEIIADLGAGPQTLTYALTPTDNEGLAPQVRTAVQNWLALGNTVLPRPQPTPEELRASLAPLSRRQLFLALASIGMDGAAVSATLDDPLDRIEWEEAGSFDRLNPLLNEVAGSLSLPPEQVDALWAWALGL